MDKGDEELMRDATIALRKSLGDNKGFILLTFDFIQEEDGSRSADNISVASNVAPVHLPQMLAFASTIQTPDESVLRYINPERMN